MDLMQYLPKYYRNSKVMQAIQGVNETELKEANNKLDDLLDQFSIDTATWGLDLLEDNYGIKTNFNKSYDERRAILKAKKRGKDTTTVNVLKNVAEAFIKEGNVFLEEEFDKYSFTLGLNSKRGFPYNLNSLYSIIEEIKPAHLRANYKLISILNSSLYISAFARYGEEITVYPYIAKNLSTKGKINVALGNNAVLENITIYPRR